MILIRIIPSELECKLEVELVELHWVLKIKLSIHREGCNGRIVVLVQVNEL